MRRRRPECVGSDAVLKSRWITVRRNLYRFDGSPNAVDYLVTDTADIALTIATTGDGTVVMVEQWKLPIGARSLEFPAGAIDTGSPLASARRELLEETGFESKRWSKLGVVFSDTGRSRNRIHVFRCEAAVRSRNPDPDPVERLCGLKVREVSRRDLHRLMGNGRIRSAGSLAAYALLRTRGAPT